MPKSPPDGKTTEIHGKAGAAAWRGPTTHVVENISDKPIEGILVKPKKPSSALPAGASDVVAADPKHSKVEFENEQVRASSATTTIQEISPPCTDIRITCKSC
jgi:hypothetical protein